MDMKDFKLDKASKIGTGFTAPEGYFDDFQTRIMANLPAQEPKVISLFERNKTWIMSVVAVLILALMVPVYMNFFQNEEEIDAVSMENYLAYQSNLSQYDLISLLDSEDIQTLDVDLALEDNTIEDILTNNNNLENYIYENE